MGTKPKLATMCLVSLVLASAANSQISSGQAPLPPGPPELPNDSAAEISPAMRDEWRARYARLSAREKALEEARLPADAEELARLEAARAVATPSEIKDFVAQSLQWYAQRMTTADLTQDLQLPRGAVVLDVAMVQFKTQFTPRRSDGTAGIQRQPGEAGLQVARIEGAQQTVLWLPELGFVLVPDDYVGKYIVPDGKAAPEYLAVKQ